MIGSDLARAAVIGVVLRRRCDRPRQPDGDPRARVAASALADGFFQPAFGGIVPLVVEQPMLPSANSWIGIARQGSAIVGPAIAAALYGTAGPDDRVGHRRRLVPRLGGRALARAPARVRSRQPQLGMRKRARDRLPLRDERAVDLDGDRCGDGDPDGRDGAVHRAPAARRAVALPPRRRLVRRCSSARWRRGWSSGSLVWARWHPRRRRVVDLLRARSGSTTSASSSLALSPLVPARESPRSPGAASGSASGSPRG